MPSQPWPTWQTAKQPMQSRLLPRDSPAPHPIDWPVSQLSGPSPASPGVRADHAAPSAGKTAEMMSPQTRNRMDMNGSYDVVLLSGEGGFPPVENRWSVLFDVDGVLVDSADAHRRVWEGWARRRGLDPRAVHAATQGRRRIDTLRLLVPERPVEDENRLLDELMAAEEPRITAYPGAADLLRSLPASAWAVVTSSRAAATVSRLRTLGLPVPSVRICAEDVSDGKPSPTGYLAAAKALSVEPGSCVVVEDSPAGVEAGRAAGCLSLIHI